MLSAGRTNALTSKYASAVGLARFPSPTASGRCVAVNPRTVVPVPDGSPLLKEGVRNGPDWSKSTPVTSHPPTSASEHGTDVAEPPAATARLEAHRETC